MSTHWQGKLKIELVILMGIFIWALPMKNIAQTDSKRLPTAAEKAHSNLVKQLSGDQVEALSKIYPDFRILAVCAGTFSGADRNELVLGVWKPVETKQKWKSEVHRVGLIWNRAAWEVHIIDDEIEKDKALSRSYPMNWEYSLDDNGFVAGTKCGIETEFRKDSDLTFALGDRPFFNRKKLGLGKNKVVCFATSDVYNNWDCVIYSPKEGRFRLWYQQAHAD